MIEHSYRKVTVEQKQEVDLLLNVRKSPEIKKQLSQWTELFRNVYQINNVAAVEMINDMDRIFGNLLNDAIIQGYKLGQQA